MFRTLQYPSAAAASFPHPSLTRRPPSALKSRCNNWKVRDQLHFLCSANLTRRRRQLRSHQSISNSAKSEFKVKTWFICNLFMTTYKNCCEHRNWFNTGHVLKHYKHYGFYPRAIIVQKKWRLPATANIDRVTLHRHCLPRSKCGLGVIASEIENGTCLNNCPGLAWPPPGAGLVQREKCHLVSLSKCSYHIPNWDKTPNTVRFT